MNLQYAFNFISYVQLCAQYNILYLHREMKQPSWVYLLSKHHHRPLSKLIINSVANQLANFYSKLKTYSSQFSCLLFLEIYIVNKNLKLT